MRTMVVVKEHWPGAEPGRIALERGADGRLWCTQGTDRTAVTVRRCFPWSRPDRHVSLRDDDEQEVALVRDPAELDAASRAALEIAMAEAGFLFELTGVRAVEEEVEIRHWRVETRQGPRVFQTRLEEWPRPLPGGGFLLRDIGGDLYRIPDADALDGHSRKVLWAYVD